MWSLQQRVCSGFSPDSLLSAFYSAPDCGKDRKFFTESKSIQQNDFQQQNPATS